MVLAEQLGHLLEEFGYDNVQGYRRGSFPYIDVDSDGVRIRRITYMNKSKQEEFVRKADRSQYILGHVRYQSAERCGWSRTVILSGSVQTMLTWRRCGMGMTRT